jgi:hypothetical protein
LGNVVEVALRHEDSCLITFAAKKASKTTQEKCKRHYQRQNTEAAARNRATKQCKMKDLKTSKAQQQISREVLQGM